MPAEGARLRRPTLEDQLRQLEASIKGLKTSVEGRSTPTRSRLSGSTGRNSPMRIREKGFWQGPFSDNFQGLSPTDSPRRSPPGTRPYPEAHDYPARRVVPVSPAGNAGRSADKDGDAVAAVLRVLDILGVSNAHGFVCRLLHALEDHLGKATYQEARRFLYQGKYRTFSMSQPQEGWAGIRDALTRQHGSLRGAFVNMNVSGRRGDFVLSAEELHRGMMQVGMPSATERILTAVCDSAEPLEELFVTYEEFMWLLGGECDTAGIRLAGEEVYSDDGRMEEASSRSNFSTTSSLSSSGPRPVTSSHPSSKERSASRRHRRSSSGSRGTPQNGGAEVAPTPPPMAPVPDPRLDRLMEENAELKERLRRLEAAREDAHARRVETLEARLQDMERAEARRVGTLEARIDDVERVASEAVKKSHQTPPPIPAPALAPAERAEATPPSKEFTSVETVGASDEQLVTPPRGAPNSKVPIQKGRPPPIRADDLEFGSARRASYGSPAVVSPWSSYKKVPGTIRTLSGSQKGPVSPKIPGSPKGPGSNLHRMGSYKSAPATPPLSPRPVPAPPSPSGSYKATPPSPQGLVKLMAEDPTRPRVASPPLSRRGSVKSMVRPGSTGGRESDVASHASKDSGGERSGGQQPTEPLLPSNGSRGSQASNEGSPMQ